MDKYLEDNKHYNNNILFISKHVMHKADKIESQKDKNKHKCWKEKEEYSLNEKNANNSRIKNKFQEFKENIYYNNSKKMIINNELDKDKKFIRLKKGLHFKIKSKTSRNNKNNDNVAKILEQNNNKQLINLTNNQKESNSCDEDFTAKNQIRKKEILNHSYSLNNYLDISSNFGLKLKPSFKQFQIFDTHFVKSIKNQKRKNNLIEAIEKYKRFKTLIPNNSEGYLCGFDQKYNLIENRSKTERVAKRIEQINRIKIQNILNFNKIYESIQNKKILDKNRKEHERRKTENNLEKSQKNFRRQLLSEEKYIIEDDGNKKVVEINHSFLPKEANIQINREIKDDFVDSNKYGIFEQKKNLQNIDKRIILPSKKINTAIKESNLICHKKRISYDNLKKNVGANININNNKLFIKKHPSNPKIHMKSKLNNKYLANEKFDNKNINLDYKNRINNIKNYNYLEIKNISETDINNQYQNNIKYDEKLFNRILSKKLISKSNQIKNTNFKIIYDTDRNKNNSDYHNINYENNKNFYHSNRSNYSKGNFKNNFIYEIINKEKLNKPKQYILFNLNNHNNNSNENNNNNFIIINAAPIYK